MGEPFASGVSLNGLKCEPKTRIGQDPDGASGNKHRIERRAVTEELQLFKKTRRTLAASIRLRDLAKSTKSSVKPFLVLIAASALTWTAVMAIHGF